MSWPPPGYSRRKSTEEAFGPPITEEEAQANLSELERKLNKEMKCFAGRNQVYLRSLLTGRGTTKPRIALKCYLRRDINEDPEVYYEWIRDKCCGDPTQCPAYQAFMAKDVI